MACQLEVRRGRPSPLGSTIEGAGVNFAVFSRHATSMSLVIFQAGTSDIQKEIRLDPTLHRTGDVWHVFAEGLGPGTRYGFRAAREPNAQPHIHRFNRDVVLVDPYAKALDGARQWTAGLSEPGPRARHSVVVGDDFDWGDEQPLTRHLADSVIYELHVRGFTKHPSSEVAHPGTFLGVAEKIPYLKDLGVTAVELMPVTDFDENDNSRTNALTGQRLVNFWGYNPLTFFAPKASYATAVSVGSEVREFKAMVKALHSAGIEVILDMVFNHTAEADGRGPTISFRGLENSVYYLISPDTGAYRDYSGCGNTVNCNHPMVRAMILDCLCYWVTEMHVDGFRFDMASVLGRGRDGSVLREPPVLEQIAAHPVLANTKLIAEPWDAAGLYQVGTFPNWGRWAEWNGRFRDDVRRFIRGDANTASLLASRLMGSPDLYQDDGRSPYHSINFVTSHDGFTLADVVSYNHKHNEANGEGGADGAKENFSWNCGEEGRSGARGVQVLRSRQMRNLGAILLLSQGVPMLTAGDEFARTQQGNNNAYCHDNELTWINWDLARQNADLLRFFRILIQFRSRHPVLRRRSFVEEQNNEFPPPVLHGTKLAHHDFSQAPRSLAVHFKGGSRGDDLYVMANGEEEARDFELPIPGTGRGWYRFMDTILEPPAEIAEDEKEPRVEPSDLYTAGPRSVVVLISK